MKKILLLSAVLILTLQQCSSPTGPPPPPIKPVKDPRTYTWTIDTLFYPTGLQTSMKSIWGSSPDNMYTVGFCGDIRGQTWHYDGKQWKNFYLPFGVRYSFSDIYGFSANDIWVVGGYGTRSTMDSTFIMHFDGGSWKRINASGGKIIETVWGSSPNNIWFGGINGTLFHWDGTSVKRDSLPIYIPKDADPFYNFNKIYGKPSGGTYFLTSAPSSGKSYLLLRKQESLSVIDSSARFRRRMWVSEKGDIYESGSGGFYKWTGGSWTNLLGRFDGFTVGIGATSESNMFIVGSGSTPEAGRKYTGLVYHYNGKDFYLYENLKLEGAQFYNVWTDGTEVFIVGVTGEFLLKTIILHGK